MSPDEHPQHHWKDALYQFYVSSGHVCDSGQSAGEHFAPRKKYMDAMIRRNFPARRDVHILDIGCARCSHLLSSAPRISKYSWSFDDSEQQVELARRLGINGFGRDNGLGFLRSNDSASADVICLFDVLEHLARQKMWNLLEKV